MNMILLFCYYSKSLKKKIRATTEHSKAHIFAVIDKWLKVKVTRKEQRVLIRSIASGTPQMYHYGSRTSLNCRSTVRLSVSAHSHISFFVARIV